MSLKRRNKLSENFSMASMTDIIFLLLIFFLVASTFIVPNVLNVKLPEAKKQEDSLQSSKRLELHIDENLNYVLCLDRDEVKDLTLEEIKERLQDYLVENPESTLLVYADQAIAYKEIVKVLSLSAEANLKIVLATSLE